MGSSKSAAFCNWACPLLRPLEALRAIVRNIILCGGWALGQTGSDAPMLLLLLQLSCHTVEGSVNCPPDIVWTPADGMPMRGDARRACRASCVRGVPMNPRPPRGGAQMGKPARKAAAALLSPSPAAFSGCLSHFCLPVASSTASQVIFTMVLPALHL